MAAKKKGGDKPKGKPRGKPFAKKSDGAPAAPAAPASATPAPAAPAAPAKSEELTVIDYGFREHSPTPLGSRV